MNYYNQNNIGTLKNTANILTTNSYTTDFKFAVDLSANNLYFLKSYLDFIYKSIDFFYFIVLNFCIFFSTYLQFICIYTILSQLQSVHL